MVLIILEETPISRYFSALSFIRSFIFNYSRRKSRLAYIFIPGSRKSVLNSPIWESENGAGALNGQRTCVCLRGAAALARFFCLPPVFNSRAFYYPKIHSTNPAGLTQAKIFAENKTQKNSFTEIWKFRDLKWRKEDRDSSMKRNSEKILGFGKMHEAPPKL